MVLSIGTEENSQMAWNKVTESPAPDKWRKVYNSVIDKPVKMV
jgi:hypothetical protein